MLGAELLSVQSKSTVKRALGDLEKAHYIRHERRYRQSGGNSSNLYFVERTTAVAAEIRNQVGIIRAVEIVLRKIDVGHKTSFLQNKIIFIGYLTL